MLLSKFKKFSLLPLSFALGFLIFMGIAVVYAWTEPSQTPPNGNVAAPLNIGSSSQYKSGALGVGGIFHGYSTGIFDGNVGIGTASPGTMATGYTLTGSSVHLERASGNFNLIVSGDDPELHFFNRGDGGNNRWQRAVLRGDDLIFGSVNDNGTNRNDNILVIEGTGNVGIGTTGPSQKLDVAGYIKGQSGLCMGNDCRTSWPAGGDITGSGTANYIAKFTGTKTIANSSIFDNGNVGIGTTGPGAQLHLADIYGAGGKNLLIGDDTYLSDIDQANILGIYGEQNSDRAGIRLGSDGSYIFGDNGNMGIGTTGPSQKLDVAGYIKGQSGLCMGNDCRTSWPTAGIKQTQHMVDGVGNTGCTYNPARETWLPWNPNNYPGLVSFLMTYDVGGTNQGRTYVAMWDRTTGSPVAGTERSFNSDQTYVNVAVNSANLVSGHLYGVASKIPSNCEGNVIFGATHAQFILTVQ